MKTHFTLFLALLLGLHAQAQLIPELKAVQLYYNTAQVTYSVSFKANAGSNSLKIGPLPLSMVQNSITFGINPNYFVQTVHFELPELISEVDAKSIYDSIQQFSLKNIFLKKDLARFQSELALLNDNWVLGDAQNHVDGAETGKLLEYQLAQREKLDSLMATIQREIASNEAKIRTSTAKRADIIRKNSNIQFLHVQVKCDKAGTYELSFTTFVRNANWSPIYNLRKSEKSNQLTLELKAAINQFTGADWNNVSLSLVNTAPDKSVELPKLTIPSLQGRNNQLQFTNAPISIQEYPISKSIDVKSSPNAMIVLADTLQVPAVIQSQLFPLVDPQAYVTATISNWASYNFIASQLLLFNEDEFAGKTSINLGNVSDSLQVSLGKDHLLVSKREVFPTERKTALLSKDKIIYSSKITVKNNHQQSISVVVWDRIPIANGFTLELLEQSGAVCDSSTGMLKWVLTLNAGEVKELPIKYQLAVPQGMRVNVGVKN